MRRLVRQYGLQGVLVVFVVLVACGRSGAHRDEIRASSVDVHPATRGFTTAEGRRILAAAAAQGSSVPAAELAAEGKKVFNSTTFAKQGESCGSCHTGGGGRNAELGTMNFVRFPGDKEAPRTPPALWGVSKTAPYGWDAREPDLTLFTAGAIFTHFRPEQGFCDPCTGANQKLTPAGDRAAAAMVAYMNTLDAPRTDFDNGTMSDAALRGQALFQGKGGCISCHRGPQFTDNTVHVLGVPPIAPDRRDSGNKDVPGAFNTPTLRDISRNAPYMHDGVFKDLHEVLDFYSGNKTVGVPVLTADEKADLIAYLDSL
jgi:cytochrome c peroxidase